MNDLIRKILILVLFVQAIQAQAQVTQTGVRKGFFKRLWFQGKKPKNKSNNSFEQLYYRAMYLYELGIPDSVSKTLSKDSLKHYNFNMATKAQKIETYRIKALALVLMDDLPSAQKSIKKLLALSPNYHPREDDLADFLWQKKQMIIVPKLSLSMEVGLNITSPNVRSAHTIFDYSPALLYQYEFQHLGNYDELKNTVQSVYQAPNKYSFNWGKEIGINLEYALTKHFRIMIKNKYERLAFEHHSQILRANFKHLIDYGHIALRLNYMLFVRYFYNNTKWRPYLHVGGFSRILLNARKLENITNTVRNVQLQSKPHAYGMLWGLGLRRVGKKSWIALELERKNSFSNLSNPSNRLLNNDASTYIFDFYDVHQDVILNSWAVNLHLGMYLNYKVFRKRKARR